MTSLLISPVGSSVVSLMPPAPPALSGHTIVVVPSAFLTVVEPSAFFTAVPDWVHTCAAQTTTASAANAVRARCLDREGATRGVVMAGLQKELTPPGYPASAATCGAT